MIIEWYEQDNDISIVRISFSLIVGFFLFHHLFVVYCVKDVLILSDITEVDHALSKPKGFLQVGPSARTPMCMFQLLHRTICTVYLTLIYE